MAAVTCLAAISAAQVSVSTYHNNNYRTGLNPAESILTSSNVNPSTFGLLFTLPVDGQVYAQPLYVSGVTIPGKGVHNVVYVATEHNSLYAFDADKNQGSNANPLWQVNFGPSVPNGDTGTDDINPEVGITGTPVISLATPHTGTLYVVAKTKELDVNNQTIYVQRLHAVDITTGNEVAPSPVTIQATVNGIGEGNDGAGHVPFNPLIQHNRAALLLVNTGSGGNAKSTLYIAFASHGDNGPYHGWILSYDANTLVQQYAYNTTPNALNDPSGYPIAAGGIWQGGAGLASDGLSLYFSTGNGTFDPSTGAYGDAVLRIDPRLGLNVADYFCPSNQDSLNRSDADLGSGGVMLLPPDAGSPTNPNLLVQAGKQGSIYLMNRMRLGHYNPTDNVVQELPNAIAGVWGMPAYFNKTIYYGGSGASLVAIPISGASMSSISSFSPTGFGYPGPTPSVSANGTTNGIVWAIDTSGYGSGGTSILHAYDASNLATELYHSDATNGRDVLGGAVKFDVPTIANGKVYVGSTGLVGVFGIGKWVDPPTITPASGNYNASIFVTVNDTTPGAKIYYTLDGSTPTQSSTLYTGRVKVSTSVTFLAKGFLAGYGSSPVVEADYQLGAIIGHGNGLRGNYYDGTTTPTGTPTATRIDPTINFDWAGGSPIAGVGGTNWSAEWKGYVQAETSSTYTFYTNSDDGVRVWVNGQLIIDNWTDHPPTTNTSSPITLQGGHVYTIVVDFYQGGGGSTMHLFWQAPGMLKQVVPSTNLYGT